MANKYWYNGGASAPWNTLANWYDACSDIYDVPSSLGASASALPTTGDKVFLLGGSPPSDGPGSSGTHIAFLWFSSLVLTGDLAKEISQYIDIQANGRLLIGNPDDVGVHHWGGTATAAGITYGFASGAINDGILGDGITFGMGELDENQGTIGDDAIFLDLGTNNYGTIGDRCTYPGDNQTTGIIGDDATLNNGHINNGTIGDRATFVDSGWNVGTAGTGAVFQGTSKNTGTVSGDATFEDTAYMLAGAVTGDLHVASKEILTGTCDGDIYIEVAGAQCRVSPGSGKSVYLSTATATNTFQPELKNAVRLTYTTTTFNTTDNLDGTWTIQAKSATNCKWCPYTVSVFLTDNDPEADPQTYSDYDDGAGAGTTNTDWVFDYVNGKLTVPFQPKVGASYGYLTLVKNVTPPVSQTISLLADDLEAANIKAGKTILGVDGNVVAYDSGTDVKKSAVAAAADVKAGVGRWTGATGGDVGTYPTTATTQAADKSAIEAATLDTDGTDSVIALPNGVNATAGTALVYAAGEAAQLAADVEDVEAVQDSILETVTDLLGVAGTLAAAAVLQSAGGDIPANAVTTAHGGSITDANLMKGVVSDGMTPTGKTPLSQIVADASNLVDLES